MNLWWNYTWNGAYATYGFLNVEVTNLTWNLLWRDHKIRSIIISPCGFFFQIKKKHKASYEAELKEHHA